MLNLTDSELYLLICLFDFLLLLIHFLFLQELDTELKKEFESMINNNRRRVIMDLADFYNDREGSDLARRSNPFY